MSSSSFVGHALSDLEGRFLDVDANFVSITERAPTGLTGCHILDITHPEDRPQNHDDLERLRQTGAPFRICKRYVRPSGEIIWVENDVSLFSDGRGGQRLVGAIRLIEVGEERQVRLRPAATKRDLSRPLAVALKESLADALAQAHADGRLEAFLAWPHEEDVLVRIVNGLMEAHGATALDGNPITRKLIEAVILHVCERLAEEVDPVAATAH